MGGAVVVDNMKVRMAGLGGLVLLDASHREESQSDI